MKAFGGVLKGAVLAALLVFPALQGVKAAAGGDDEIVIVAFGDSLSAGLFLPQRDAFPNQLEAALRKKGHKVRVLNASVSGDTTAGGLARLDWAVPKEADAVILELGANDALRGIDPKLSKTALDRIVTRLKQKGVEVLIAGMEAPRGMGKGYAKGFRSIYREIAEKHAVALYPFFLDGIALKQKYNLPDGMHPNAKGVGVIVKNILPAVEKLIERVKVAGGN